MPITRVIIGPFSRRALGDALALSLKQDRSLAVSQVGSEAEVESFLNATETVVVLLEQRGSDTLQRFMPLSDSVSVILIDGDGRGDVQVALREVGLSRMRSIIGLLAESPHPKVFCLDQHLPLASEQLLRDPGSGLAPVLAWLDTAFALVLDRFAAARGGQGDAPWMEELLYLKAHFLAGRQVSRERESELFDAMAEAPLWHQPVFRTLPLAPEELKLLCLAAAPDLDQRYGQAVGLLQNNFAESRPSATTLSMFFSPDHVGGDILTILKTKRPFARLKLIRTEADGPQPGYRVPREVIELLFGIRRCSGQDWSVQWVGLDAEPQLAASLGRLLSRKAPPLVLVDGGNAYAAGEIAAAVLANEGPVLRVKCTVAEAGQSARLVDWALAARIHDAVLMIENAGVLPGPEQEAMLTSDVGCVLRGMIVIGATEIARSQPNGRGIVHAAVKKPGGDLISARWLQATRELGVVLNADDARSLAGTLRLPPEEIVTLAQMAVSAAQCADGGADVRPKALLEAARHLAARHAPETVRIPECIFGWNDIVLPDTIRTVVELIPEHVRHSQQVLDEWDFVSRLPYGRGVGALFSGPSGTGKTMCAQVIAACLGVELMQVEIARCVSKYIGETEKNIDRCFQAAEAASAVLLFDEADALFGKRTEIKDAHDRHANVEVAYLLQRIEAYEGLVILTTNLKNNIDPAFLRRLRFVVDFPMPEAADRERIWKLAFPDAAKRHVSVDTAFLARRLPLSGGSIQAIAVNAAFGAVAESAPEIHMRHVMAATRTELLKMGMLSVERELTDPHPEPLVLEGCLT
ncbi:AAA family ATPase [Ruegeria meonggei]|uniref:AAA family ATPase n=1 Tax=Ruegeria meonggei TaxID=1446476 RepID=UPI00366C5FC5